MKCPTCNEKVFTIGIATIYFKKEAENIMIYRCDKKNCMQHRFGVSEKK